MKDTKKGLTLSGLLLLLIVSTIALFVAKDNHVYSVPDAPYCSGCGMAGGGGGEFPSTFDGGIPYGGGGGKGF